MGDALDRYEPDAPTCDGDGSLPPLRCCNDRACPCDVQPSECPGCPACSPCPDCDGEGTVEQSRGQPLDGFYECPTCDGRGSAER